MISFKDILIKNSLTFFVIHLNDLFYKSNLVNIIKCKDFILIHQYSNGYVTSKYSKKKVWFRRVEIGINIINRVILDEYSSN